MNANALAFIFLLIAIFVILYYIQKTSKNKVYNEKEWKVLSQKLIDFLEKQEDYFKSNNHFSKTPFLDLEWEQKSEPFVFFECKESKDNELVYLLSEEEGRAEILFTVSKNPRIIHSSQKMDENVASFLQSSFYVPSHLIRKEGN